MKHITMAFLIFVMVISCKNREKEIIQENNHKYTETGKNSNEGKPYNNSNLNEENKFIEIEILNNDDIIYSDNIVSIEYDLNEINIASYNDDDMEKNVVIVYKSESDVILNVDEIEPDKIICEILDKPVVDTNIILKSEYSDDPYFNGIEEIVKLFGINISADDVERINNMEHYKTIKIITENITLYVYKEYYANNIKLFAIEYNSNNSLYDFKIKTDLDKDDIIKLLGKPSSYSEERNIFVYRSNETLRQINIKEVLYKIICT
jgi:hypothetical protein